MKRTLNKLRREEKGQALIIAVILMLVGGLIIAPLLGYMGTGLKVGQVFEKNMDGLYAADTGVEDALWKVIYTEEGPPSSYSLGDTVNGMEVTIQTEAKGAQGEHHTWLGVSGEIAGDEPWPPGSYPYTITVFVTDEAPGVGMVVHLIEVGASLPEGYSYDWEQDLAALFPGNLSTTEPSYDEDFPQVLRWHLEPPYPEVTRDSPRSQNFYVIGEGSPGEHYAWVIANRGDIGMVFSEGAGDIGYEFYKITATATRPGDSEPTAIVVADVLNGGGELYILCWQISK